MSTNIDDFFEVCNKSFSGFHSVQYLICESFSTDRTVEKLEGINQKRKNMRWFKDSEIDIAEGLRTARIASARNQLIKKIISEYPNIDYVVMADMDEEKKRRAGDPAFLYAEVILIKSAIGIGAKHSIEASTRKLF